MLSSSLIALVVVVSLPMKTNGLFVLWDETQETQQRMLAVVVDDSIDDDGIIDDADDRRHWMH
jgi:hypothetical protein